MTRATPLQQSTGFARALTAYGATVLSDEPVLLQRQFGRFGRLVFASRAAVDAVSGTPVRILNGEHDCPQSYRDAGFRQIITPAHIAEWDLRRTDLRPTMSGKWRNQLIKGERAGLRIKETNWRGNSHWLFENAEKLARQRRFRPLPTGLLAMFAHMNRNDAVIFEAFDRATPVAACLILRHGPVATYQTAWSAPKGYALQAPRVLLHHAATRMAALGHVTLDLGLVQTDTAAGLARFKLGSGARLRKLGGTWIRLGRC